MQKVLNKQELLLNELLKNRKTSKEPALDQPKEKTSKVKNADSDRLIVVQEENGKSLKEISSTLKHNSETTEKIFKEIKKQTASFRSLSKKETNDITEKSLGRRQYNTLKPRLANFKDNIKDFFSIRGFLDKTGIVQRKGGGIISEYLDRREDKQNYIKERMKVDPTARLHGKDKAKEIFSKQWDKQQDIQYDMSRNEKAIQKMKAAGLTDKQIERSDEFKKRQSLAFDMAKVDSRVRPEGYNVDTGLVKQKPKKEDKEDDKSKKDKNALGSEEGLLEQNRMIQEQTELLIRIADNTEGLSKDKQPKVKKEEAEEGGGGILSSLMSLAGMIKSAGSAIFGAAKSVVSSALGVGRTLMAGARGFLGAAGGGAIATGAAMVAAPFAVDALVGAAGYGNKEIDEKQDDANWNRMKWYQKAESGVARGIEKIGNLFGGNISNEARAQRIKNETEYLDKHAEQPKQEDKKNNLDKKQQQPMGKVDINFSEAEFSQKDPENYKKFIEYRNTRYKEILKETKPKSNSALSKKMQADQAQQSAKREAIIKFRKEIEAAGAGTVKGAENYTPPSATKEEEKPQAKATANKEDLVSLGEQTGEFANSAEMTDSAPKSAEKTKPYPNLDASLAQKNADMTKAAAKNAYHDGTPMDAPNPSRIDVEKDKGVLTKYAQEEAAKFGRKTPDAQDRKAAMMRLRAERSKGVQEQAVIEPVKSNNAAKVDAASAENESQKEMNKKAQPAANTVIAPTTVNNKTTQNQIKPPVKNQESSLGNYLDRKYAALRR